MSLYSYRYEQGFMAAVKVILSYLKAEKKNCNLAQEFYLFKVKDGEVDNDQHVYFYEGSISSISLAFNEIKNLKPGGKLKSLKRERL